MTSFRQPSPDEEAEAKRNGDEYFGVCPVCGDSDGHLDDGPEHWRVCHKHKHKLKWWIGTNLFSGWKSLPPEEAARQAHVLSTYAVAEATEEP